VVGNKWEPKTVAAGVADVDVWCDTAGGGVAQSPSDFSTHAWWDGCEWGSSGDTALAELEQTVSVGLGRIVALHHLLILFTPDSLTYSVPLFLTRQCDRTPGGRPQVQALHLGAEDPAGALGAQGPGVSACQNMQPIDGLHDCSRWAATSASCVHNHVASAVSAFQLSARRWRESAFQLAG
jgi:hypothetical protein